ncbi:RNA-guided endonuclease InsQ/TnpB family protein [Synechococcus sp. H70.2]|uniref:RNA-guided endonuclease InsQ/TnpB family protein n=1 Tax=Synechococcus sp. H70.2 TaxID=2964528 RepID=UPI0039C49488
MTETALVVRRQTFRLYPNKTQERALLSARRLHCYLYNACVAHRRYEYRRNRRTVTYLEQQNLLPEFKKAWPEFAQLHSMTLQATVKRVDFAYQRFFQGLSKKPKFKSIKRYSGWTYPSATGWKVNTNGKHGTVTLRDLGITLRMRGKASRVSGTESLDWGRPTTLTIVYKPTLRQWYASFTVEVEVPRPKLGSQSDLKYESIVAYDLGTETAITLYDGSEFYEVANPRFRQRSEEKVRKVAKLRRRKRAPRKGVKASRRWKKINRLEAKLKAKVARQRRDWQHKITSEIARRYDKGLRPANASGVTEKLDVKGMTRQAKGKGKKRKAALNKSILSVGFGALNQMLTYKIEQKGGLVLFLPTQTLKPSQRCPQCGAIHKEWADLSHRYHVCPACGFAIPRDRGTVMVLYNVATNWTPSRCREQQPGLGTRLVSLGCFSSTSQTRYTGSMKQLGQKKRQKLCCQAGEETPPAYAVG